MDKEKRDNLILAIKTDNLALFSEAVKDNLNISFGRFPLLSLCHMYKANKIINKFHNVLLQINSYEIIEEPYEFYEKFKTLAGRSMRLYIGGNIVSPIEMLAILNEDDKVKSIYKRLKTREKNAVKKNLETIYIIHSQNPKITLDKLRLRPRKLSKKQRLPFKIALASMISVVLILTSLLLAFNFTAGLGTDSNPYKIYNEKQFLLALSSKSNCILKNDLKITSDLSDVDVSCVLDGKGKKITFKNPPKNGVMINKNKGKISNLVIDYPAVNQELSSSLSLLAKENLGSISNVKIVAGTLNLTCNRTAYEDMYISGIANKNSGTIDDCLVQFDCIVETTGNGECFVSGIAGENSGTIKNCKFDGSISSTEADISGIATSNLQSGKIINCKNLSNLSQTSAKNEWSPTVAGITLNNFGEIKNTINKGDVKVESLNDLEDALGNVLVAGISAYNYGTVEKCLNYGDVTALSKRLIVYAGGVTAISTYYTENNRDVLYPYINNCGTESNLEVSTSNDGVFVFAGGIAGRFQNGEIKDSFSLTNFITEPDSQKYFFGLLFGCSYVDLWSGSIYFSPNNNFVLAHANAQYQIGTLINGSSIVSETGVDVNTGINVTSEVIIKSKEIYFYE